MDYKGGRHLTEEQRQIITKFSKDRKIAIIKRMNDFFNTNDLLEQKQIREYVIKNFKTYILSVMYLYEDSLIYSGFNELKEFEKYFHFLQFFKFKAVKENLSFLDEYKLVSGISPTDSIHQYFLSYEQDIVDMLNDVIKYNNKFKYHY